MNEMNQNTNPVAGGGEKTFTQDDVNRIVGERLAKERAKTTADRAGDTKEEINDVKLREKERELEQRELRLSAREMLIDKGLPEQLLDALNCSDKETMEKSILIIKEVFNGYESKLQKPIKIIGAVPGSGLRNDDIGGDYEIRKAMGLKV